MVLDEEDEGGMLVSGCVVFFLDLLTACLHGTSIHHCTWFNALSGLHTFISSQSWLLF